MDVPVLADQQELIHIISEWTLEAVWKTWQEQSIGMDGGKKSEKSILFVWFVDNDDPP